MANLPPELSPDQLSTIAFSTGLTATGVVNTNNGWSWLGTTPASYSGDNVGSAHKWGGGVAGTPGGTVSYYFDPGSGFTPGIEQIYQASLALWSDESNVQFVQTTNPSTAQLSFYLFNTSTPNVPLDNGAYAVPVYAVAQPGATIIPTTQAVSISIEQTGGWAQLDSFTYSGGYGPSTVVHELGHAMGLMHTGPYNGDVQANIQQLNATDMYLWSIMSYIGPNVTNAKYYNDYPVKGTNYNTQISTVTPQMLDILGVQQLYGLPTSTTFSGGQVFGFNTNISDASKAFFDFTQDINPVVTIWDSGTDNTLDLSGFYTPSFVDLNPGTFSNADGMINNIAIAFNTAIDTAIGGAGNDTFIVNANADTINGGGGSDTVVFAGVYANYVINGLGSGVYSVTNGAVADTISNVETLAFADQTVAIADLPMGDTFEWNTGDGAYNDKTNWTNTTTGGPAIAPPGAGDIAVIDGPTSGGPQTITNSGTAEQLIFTGLSGVTGNLNSELLTVGQGGTGAATVTIAPGATIDTNSAGVVNGTLIDIGTLKVTNALMLAPTGSGATSTIAIRSGGIAQIGTLLLNGGSVSVDATSTFEVGNAGTAGTQNITVDPGSTLSGNGTLPGVIDNGTVIAAGGTLSVGYLASKGQAYIATDSTLNVGIYGATAQINFQDATGALMVQLGAMQVPLGTLSGFVPGDVITINTTQPILQPVYNGGTLTVGVSGISTGISAAVIGNYSSNVFVALPTAPGSFSLLTAPGTLSGSTTPSAGTAKGAAYGWAAGGSGDWNTVANWGTAVPNQAPITVAPGSKDIVFIQGASEPNTIQVISGNGNANALGLVGTTAFSGSVTVGGSLQVGDIGNVGVAALIGKGAMSAGNATIVDGVFDVASGTALTVAGTLSIITNPTQSIAPLEIYGGGAVQVSSLSLSGSLAPIALDSASRIEVGNVGETAAGVLTIDPGHTVSGSGDLSKIGLTDDGTIFASGGQLTLGAVTGTGALIIGNKSTLAVATSKTNPITFSGTNDTLLIASTQGTFGTVTGFTQGETIAVSGLPQSLPTKVTYSATGTNIGTLSLTDPFGTNVSFTLIGNYAHAKFVIGPGGSSSVADVTIACFAAGTRIATPHGETAVEALREGDLVRVHFADAPLAISWIGHREIDCRRHPAPPQVWPVRVRAGCFGRAMPSRDLYLSPDHAVFADGVLVPVKYLINGTTITQIETDQVTYHHVELARHDLVFAEGLPTESYLDTGDRAKFANGGVVVSAYPDFATRLWEAEGCAPLVIAGPLLTAIRQRVDLQAAKPRRRRAA